MLLTSMYGQNSNVLTHVRSPFAAGDALETSLCTPAA
jgi:hypothetical protein